MLRTSDTCSTGSTTSRTAATAASAAPASARATKYSLCSSSPLLGVNSSLKWGSRSNHGPGTPSWTVQFSAGIPGTGFQGSAAARAPHSSRSGPAPAGSPIPSTRCFDHTWNSSGSSNRVKRLTL